VKSCIRCLLTYKVTAIIFSKSVLLTQSCARIIRDPIIFPIKYKVIKNCYNEILFNTKKYEYSNIIGHILKEKAECYETELGQKQFKITQGRLIDWKIVTTSIFMKYVMKTL
jgi:hypothetical protein